MRVMFSVVAAVLIVGIAAFLGMRQGDDRVALEEEWRELEERAMRYQIPTDTAVAYQLGKTRKRSTRMVRKEEVGDYAERFMAFFLGMREREQQGGVDQLEAQKEAFEMVEEMLDFSTEEMEMLVEMVMAEEDLDEELKGDIVWISIMVLSQEQPELALTLVLKTRDAFDEDPRSYVGVALGQLAKVDPTMALDWMDDHGEEIGGVTDELRREVLENAALQDVKVALGLLHRMDVKDQSMAVLEIANLVTVETANDFLAGVRKMNEEELGEAQAFRALGRSGMITNFEGTTKWIEEAGLTDAERSEFLKGLNVNLLIEGKGDESLGKWLGWLGTQRGDGSKNASQRFLKEWTRQDFRAAGEWINTLEKGRQRDLAALSYAETLAQHEPAAAVPWAETLPAGAGRLGVLRRIHGRLLEKNPAAAAALAKKHGLEE